MDNQDVSSRSELFCCFCLMDFKNTQELFIHRSTEHHRVQWLKRCYRLKRKEFVANKEGISLAIKDKKVHYRNTAGLVFITTDVDPVTFPLTINFLGENDVAFCGADILSDFYRQSVDQNMVKLYDEEHILTSDSTKVIKFGKAYRNKYVVTVTIQPGSPGRKIRVPIILHFLKMGGTHLFHIARTIEIQSVLPSQLKEYGNYSPGVHITIKNNQLGMESSLRPCHIPTTFQTLAFDGNLAGLRSRMHLDNELNFGSHMNYFTTLLWLEELQLHLDLQCYSKRDVSILEVPLDDNSCITLFELFEEGLSESRPSVLVGDRVLVCLSEEERTKKGKVQWYEGIVHKTKQNSLYLAFNASFKSTPQSNYNVEFSLNRRPLKAAHRALDICSKSQFYEKLLFPKPPLTQAKPLPTLSLYNANIKDNLEQMKAVQHIVAGSSGPAPYLIFGPPGTGKTVTIVEAMKQVLFLDVSTHILACAPSNSAADVIAERILETLKPQHVLRLNAFSRERKIFSMPANLKDASNIYLDQIYMPHKDDILEKRVIICTMTHASRLSSGGFPKNFFTHIFLDEAGCATEPEALVSIAGVLAENGQIVLAGDPHQLGPVIRNISAVGGPAGIFTQNGLDTSYLERLMNNPIYKPPSDSGSYNSQYVTKLLCNYRSHAEILKIPNDCFYKSELKVKGSPTLTDSLCKWKHLPKKGFPLIFHAVTGEEKTHSKSPSFYNRTEINVVISYIRKLLSTKISLEDIGVISPYRLQVMKLQEITRSCFPNEESLLKVGSVEDFQGDERKVIIISTVRATLGHLAKDELFNLGFVRNPKRFNVAVTRAQALVIIVGCPQVLQLDENWNKLIEHIKRGGGYIGTVPPPPSENIDELIKEMSKIDIRPRVGSMKQIFEDPAWNRN